MFIDDSLRSVEIKVFEGGTDLGELRICRTEMSALGFTMDRTMSRESRKGVGKWFAMGDFAWDLIFGMGDQDCSMPN